MVKEFIEIAINTLLFSAVFIVIMLITGFIGYLAALIGSDKEKDETFLLFAWGVACLALAALACTLIVGG